MVPECEASFNHACNCGATGCPDFCDRDEEGYFILISDPEDYRPRVPNFEQGALDMFVPNHREKCPGIPKSKKDRKKFKQLR